MILLDALSEPVTWLELGRIFIVCGVMAATILIGYLTYLRGNFRAQDEDRKLRREEQNLNRELYTKNIATQVVEVPLKEIKEMIKEQGKRIDDLFTLWTKEHGHKGQS